MGEYIIYIHKSPSGKCYIGQTKQKPEQRGSNGMGYIRHPHFYKAIQKYGGDNFEHKILFEGLSKLDADLIEIDLIYYYKKMGKSYNLTAGGEGLTGFKQSDKAKKIISEKNRGRLRSEETRKRISEARKGKPGTNKGKHFSEDIKKKMSAAAAKIQVAQFDLDENFIKVGDSIRSAARELNIGAINITRACRGEYKTAGKYKGKYYEWNKELKEKPEEDDDD